MSDTELACMPSAALRTRIAAKQPAHADHGGPGFPD